jgi:histidyl-tRNA synthetase
MINPRMVRGLDYYTKTTFEVTTDFLGAQNAIVGGGRYDGLVKELGGPDIPGIGFAIGCERLLAMIPVKNESFSAKPDLFIAALGDESQQLAFRLCNHFRMSGILTEMDYLGKSLKSQMKRADKFQCAYTLILGEKELRERKAELRNMRQGTQETIGLDGIEETILKFVRAR